jgi:hypothetical protein
MDELQGEMLESEVRFNVMEVALLSEIHPPRELIAPGYRRQPLLSDGPITFTLDDDRSGIVYNYLVAGVGFTFQNWVYFGMDAHMGLMTGESLEIELGELGRMMFDGLASILAFGTLTFDRGPLRPAPRMHIVGETYKQLHNRARIEIESPTGKHTVIVPETIARTWRGLTSAMAATAIDQMTALAEQHKGLLQQHFPEDGIYKNPQDPQHMLGDSLFDAQAYATAGSIKAFADGGSINAPIDAVGETICPRCGFAALKLLDSGAWKPCSYCGYQHS